MCGFIVISSDCHDDSVDPLKVLNALSHRGPDDRGYETVKTTRLKLFFGHVRFSLTDIRSGIQPHKTKSHICLFNGEVFNYREIAAKYSIPHHHSDTNTICTVESLQLGKWDLDANGFWAFASYNFSTESLEVLRDKLGKKPLYYSILDDSNFIISSEIRPILLWRKMRGMPCDLDTQIINDYLNYGKRDHTLRTFFLEVYKVQPGIRIKISLAEVNISRVLRANSYEYFNYDSSYLYSLDTSRRIPQGPSDFLATFSSLFEDSVNARIHEGGCLTGIDVSGGIDSSCILHALSPSNFDRVRLQYIREVSPIKSLDDTHIQSLRQETPIHIDTLLLDKDDIWKDMMSILGSFEEPVHSYAFVLQNLGWRQLSEANCRVVLNGAGADEVFCGYSYYLKSHLINNGFSAAFRAYPFKALKWLINMEFYTKPLDSIPEDIQNYSLKQDIGCIYLDDMLMKPEHIRIIDLLFNRLPFWLIAMDKSMMSIPLEVRTPFLDYRLLQLSLAASSKSLFYNRYSKLPLRQYLSAKGSKMGRFTKKQGLVPNAIGTWYSNAYVDVEEFVKAVIVEHLDIIPTLDFKALPPSKQWRLFNLAVFLKNL